jgi:glycerol uptake facilitator-like aquaporin
VVATGLDKIVIDLDPGRLTTIALACGCVYAAALALTLPLSGGYLNPAVTIMLRVFRRMDAGRASFLILLQILGAFVAGLVLAFLVPARQDVLVATRLGTPHLNLQVFNAAGITLVPLLKGIGIELLLTFILVFIPFALAFDPRMTPGPGHAPSRLTPLWLGLALAVLTFLGFRFTGAALNPARWLGPALAELTVEPLRLIGPFQDHAVYWIGPLGGSLLAGWLYTTLVLPPQGEQPSMTQSRVSNQPAGWLEGKLSRWGR